MDSRESALRLYPAVFILCFLHVILPRAISSVDGGSDARTWCDATAPHPSTCLHHTVSLRVAADQAALALSQARTRPRDGRAGQAWSDCRQLVAFAVGHLNRTAAAVASGSESDTLAWLSAARTCLDTCLTGFRELGTSPGPEFQAVLANASRDVTNAIEATARRRRDTTKHNTTRTRTDVDTSQGCLRRPYGDGVALRQGRRLVPTPADADLVVAKDGTGNFCTVKEALEAAARRSDGGRVVVYVKAGVYDEHVEVWTTNLVLLGDGIGRTVITGNRSVQGGYTTFSSATFAVNADGFVACGVTFRNTAGARAQQAVALRATADRVAFYRCGFEGHQDTLYAHALRHFYRECAVAGTVDFVFGDAAAVLQRCSLRVRRPLLPGQPAVVTAQGRADRHERTGFAVHGGRVSASAKFASGGAPFGTFLGRPWKEFSRVVYMEAYMDGTVDAAGWLPWGGTEFGQDTAFYGEYRNTGPGSGTSGRVRWGGYHVITDPGEASEFTADVLVDAGSWLDSTGIPYTPGL